MRIALYAAGIAAAILSGISGAQAQFFVAGGSSVKLYFAAAINPDCSSIGTPTVRFTKLPQHGRVSTQQTKDFANFRGEARDHCNRRRVSGVAIRYTAQRGYSGPDPVTAEVFYTNGLKKTITFNIAVR